MIFLGAGASKPFGIPTMQELTEKTMTVVNEHDKVLAKRIEHNLLNAGFALDFENIYTILEALTNPIKAMKEAGPYAGFLLGDYDPAIKSEEINDLILRLRRMIYDACFIKREKMNLVESQYNDLFDSLEKYPEWSGITWYTGGSSIQLKLDSRIVTTNYDMALELYFRMKEEPIVDGFRETPNPFVREFYPSIYGNQPRKRWLIKLHGSIWQFWNKNRIIKTIDDPETSTLPIETEKEMMIYPSKEKPILRNPYYSTYNVFKNIFWNRLIVIGYSFRDDPVNTAIVDNLILNPKSRIIIIDPNASNIVKNMPEELQTFFHEGRFSAITKTIQDDYQQDLVNALGGRNKEIAVSSLHRDTTAKYRFIH